MTFTNVQTLANEVTKLLIEEYLLSKTIGLMLDDGLTEDAQSLLAHHKDVTETFMMYVRYARENGLYNEMKALVQKQLDREERFQRETN